MRRATFAAEAAVRPFHATYRSRPSLSMHTLSKHSPRVARGAAKALPLKAEGLTNAEAAPMSTTRRNANSFILLGVFGVIRATGI